MTFVTNLFLRKKLQNLELVTLPKKGSSDLKSSVLQYALPVGIIDLEIGCGQLNSDTLMRFVNFFIRSGFCLVNY